MTIRFDGKVAIVTGAGNGLGRSHALQLASLGAKVVVNDLGGNVDGTGGSSESAEQVVAEIKAAGGDAIANGSSVSDVTGVDNLVKQTMEAFGRIDLLVNNAGILRDKTFAKMSVEDFDIVVDVHLSGAAYVTRAVWPIMQEQNYGRIVMTTSGSGLYGNFGQTNYAAAKLGQVGLMNSLKQEGRKYNIKVNTLAPIAATRMTESLMPPQALAALKPELVTPAVLFMLSEDAPTGAIITAGAGFYAAVRTIEAQGVLIPGEVSADDVAAKWGEISDFDNYVTYESVNDGTGRVFKLLGEAAKG
ncbi:MAG TPA: 3-oxoacyl-ACP reductase [Alphaproteobacteria bacterium]|jgi:NAD(P)-dependent dehydrogenase (short-subunit alcohol dehydrogenase family)|nr:3-oxoacyl-ACP reductase [Alphaproteobacteria bacterium]HAM46969.1 3-oxoacyl-ACP reductase [Alphaproteobacteria bacterium]HBA43929.1 3-oxoacyl-ACP reductase [Alphaproteobacteria bacterium]HBC53874.1 3-oxoacyl-ACP reductase [Alphaproteobacteria bacterium]HBF97235.1 3-oxoacyl-ACP reductase [Alphaproteobacteria bacterium]